MQTYWERIPKALHVYEFQTHYADKVPLTGETIVFEHRASLLNRLSEQKEAAMESLSLPQEQVMNSNTELNARR